MALPTAIGRIVHWGPESEQDAPHKKRTYRAHLPDVQVCFYLEDAYISKKLHFLPDVDCLDVVPRRESVPAAGGQPQMLQLQLLPAYCLTIHKVQALTIRHQVSGCLEGIFAHGQLYVQVSRVVGPALHAAVGLPPEDSLDGVAREWAAEGWDVDELLSS